ncbi:MAG: hemerythrin domain-containing protein [Blastocatellales bacterium]
MAITIGSKLESDYTNPLGMLSDCHRRIERFLNVLLTVSKEARGGTLSEEYRNALATALRYFREGAPRHTRDEEDSLFPRLRKSQAIEARQAMSWLDDLHRDHSVADAGHLKVETLGSRWLANGHLPPDDARALMEALEFLRTLYQRHIALEDAEVFPLAGRLLPPDELRAIAREMAARRGLRLAESLS